VFSHGGAPAGLQARLGECDPQEDALAGRTLFGRVPLRLGGPLHCEMKGPLLSDASGDKIDSTGPASPGGLAMWLLAPWGQVRYAATRFGAGKEKLCATFGFMQSL
jgi:hypothetical protein